MEYGFFGSGDFAARCLELLAGWVRPSWIVTAPPRPAGRGKEPRPAPVEIFAVCGEFKDVPLVRSASASSDEAVLNLSRDIPTDFCFVIDFGQIIKEPLLREREPVGCLNIHPSLLPRFRGAAPVQRALMDGAGETGVTVFKLAQAMDAGPVLLSRAIDINDIDDTGSLLERAAIAGTEAFINYANANAIGEWSFTAQDDSSATFAPKIRASEERVDWGKSSAEIWRLTRALSPKPAAWTTIRGKRLRLIKTSRGDELTVSGEHGELLGLKSGGVVVACGDGALLLTEVQLEGKKIQRAADWWNGLRAAPGERLE
ncbi:methionyl-tRNA formyltransferase [Synergistales bacterium]|nr:methionyl-tRNA formyltransferase [Synergistales bacterium]